VVEGELQQRDLPRREPARVSGVVAALRAAADPRGRVEDRDVVSARIPARLRVDASELADAKSGLIQSLPAEFGSTTSTALAFGKLVALGRPPDYFSSYVEKLEAVTREDVANAARARFDTKGLAIVVVGPLAELRPRLEALGLGSLALRDATGEAVKAVRAVKSGSN